MGPTVRDASARSQNDRRTALASQRDRVLGVKPVHLDVDFDGHFRINSDETD